MRTVPRSPSSAGLCSSRPGSGGGGGQKLVPAGDRAAGSSRRRGSSAFRCRIPAIQVTHPGVPIPGGGGGQQTCTFQGEKIPCVTALGVWFSSQSCYAQPLDPQPPPEDPKWEGHSPDDGRVWRCLRPGIQVTWLFFFVPDDVTPGLVDPGELGREALDTMRLAVPDIHLAPGQAGPTYVHMDTWLWVGAGQFESLAKTVTAGGTAVTVTAEPIQVWWDLGDGTELSCASAGREWKSDLEEGATTDCSHVYETTSASEPGARYTVRAAIYYEASWTCSGACLRPAGSLGTVAGVASSVGVEVRERQSVVVGER